MKINGKPHGQLLSPCILLDEDFLVSKFEDHILAVEEDMFGNKILFCRACGMND